MWTGSWRPWRSHGGAATIRELLQEVVRRIVSAADPEEILIFGSTVRGKFRRHSDLDLVIIKPDIFGSEHRRRLVQKINANFFGLPVPVDIVLVTPTEVREAASNTLTFLGRAVRGGRRIYRRSSGENDRRPALPGNRARMSLADWHQLRNSSMRRGPSK